MPRPSVPLAKDIVAIAKGLKNEGICAGMVRCADGTEITWGLDDMKDRHLTELERWKAKRNAAS
jgi:hypothetical protein